MLFKAVIITKVHKVNRLYADGCHS